MENRRSKNLKNKKKKRKKKKVILISFGLVIALIISICVGYVTTEFSKIKRTAISDSNADLGISSDAAAQSKNPDAPINILLLGTDRRNTHENGNSDSIMIATIDRKYKKIKLSSIMRDSRVSIDKVGLGKINEAYARGGAQLMIKTINENFNTDIRDFVSVDFFGLEKIIDAVGGISIDVKQAEIPIMNQYIKEVSDLEKQTPPFIKSAGMQKLSGRQAVAYSRIRYVGNGDYERTERQRTVLSEMFDKVKNEGLSGYQKLINEILPNTETSLSMSEILGDAKDVVTSGTKTVEQSRFPTDSDSHTAMINGVSYIVIDNMNNTKDKLHKFIYDDVQPK